MVRIKEKVVGKQKYYYLEHSIKVEGKVRKKEKYLGKELPKKLEEIKQEFLYDLLARQYNKKLEEARKKYSSAYSKYPSAGKEKYLENFMIKFTYDSNRIEGSTLTLKETADLLQEHITPGNKPIKFAKEAEAHKKVFYDMHAYNKDLTLSIILKWHKELFEGIEDEIAGVIRKHPVGIARSKAEMPLPAELKYLIREFFEWYNKHKAKLNPVILSALVHYRFVSIHPFSDGNGRISRIMMNFILKKHGYPMINLEYSDRAAYYNALERSQTTEKEEVFVHYLVKRYLKEYF